MISSDQEIIGPVISKKRSNVNDELQSVFEKTFDVSTTDVTKSEIIEALHFTGKNKLVFYRIVLFIILKNANIS